MLAVAVPFINQIEITEKCLFQLVELAEEEIELILIDNGSDEHLKRIPQVYASHYIRNEENLGVLPSLKQALKVVQSPLMVHMHNDVLIHDKAWDSLIQFAFTDNPKLGLGGFFGAPGIDPNGARNNPVSRMVGKEWGTPGILHGRFIDSFFIEPSCIFDSLTMIWRVNAIKEVGIPEEIPPHHWFDRILTLRMIDAGWDAATIGISFDHWGSATYGPEKQKSSFDDFATKWMNEHGIPWFGDDNLYQYGLKIFNEYYSWRLPLTVNSQYNYVWANAS